MTRCDFLVVGAGIAGASVASELIRYGSVLLVEAEHQPGYHTTGRSASMFLESHRRLEMRALIRCSRAFFESPPADFAAEPLLRELGVLFIARTDQADSIRQKADDTVGDSPQIIHGDYRLAASKHPGLRPGYVAACLWNPDAAEIDVHTVLHGCLKKFRAAGGTLQTGERVTRLHRGKSCWTVQTDKGKYRAAVVVNAAGAWADRLGQMAGARKIGLVPKRRSVCILPAGPIDVSGWPMVGDVDEQFYFKPDAGNLLLSASEEIPMEPEDVQADDFALAKAVAGLEAATIFSVKQKIMRQWAGLRSFVDDRMPVVGYDNQANGFFWLAGQGGDGIQTAPALSRLAAALAVDESVPGDLKNAGITEATFSPSRLIGGRDSAASRR